MNITISRTVRSVPAKEIAMAMDLGKRRSLLGLLAIKQFREVLYHWEDGPRGETLSNGAWSVHRTSDNADKFDKLVAKAVKHTKRNRAGDWGYRHKHTVECPAWTDDLEERIENALHPMTFTGAEWSDDGAPKLIGTAAGETYHFDLRLVGPMVPLGRFYIGENSPAVVYNQRGQVVACVMPLRRDA